MSNSRALNFNEEWALVGTIDPDANATGATNSDVIDMSKFDEVVFIICAGILGTAATLDFKVQESATSGGTYTDISGASIAQLVKASNDDDQAILSIKGSSLSDGMQFVRGVHTIGAATSDSSVTILGRAKNLPASDYNLASVVESKAA